MSPHELTLTPAHMLSLLPGHVYFKNTSQYLGANPWLLITLHLPSLDQLIGENDQKLLQDDYFEPVLSYDQAVLKSQTVIIREEKEFNRYKKPGDKRDFSSNLAPFFLPVNNGDLKIFSQLAHH
jgi:hypothetical protein